MNFKTKAVVADTSIMTLIVMLITAGIGLAQMQNIYTEVVGIVLIILGIVLFALMQFLKYKGISAIENLVNPSAELEKFLKTGD